eukprot:11156097-Lingulodinium_polyedra.AAC.1
MAQQDHSNGLGFVMTSIMVACRVWPSSMIAHASVATLWLRPSGASVCVSVCVSARVLQPCPLAA